MGIYSTVMEEITWYTGLSPTAFFTILTMMIFVYQIVCSMFVSPQDSNLPPTVPVSYSNNSNSNFFNNDSISNPQKLNVGKLTEEQLRAYDGSDPNKPILMAIKGQIYDVSSSRMFYGPGGSYSMFAGRDASRALALLSFKPQDINGNIEGLCEEELAILEDWEDKFIEKYAKVGKVVHEKTKIKHLESGDGSKISFEEEKGKKLT